MRVLMAASGGGHLRQVMDLEAFWSCHDTVIATEDTALARSLAEKHPCLFFAHFAFGQRHTDGWRALAVAAARNLRDSWRIVRQTKPDVIVSTGAGSAFFSVLFGKLRGANIVVVDSFARFDAPSLFARLAHRLADHFVVQSAALVDVWKGAILADPFRVLDGPRPEKTATAVVTVGTVMPFDRLVEGVARLKNAGLLPEDVWAQVGEGGLEPDGFACVPGAPFADMQARLARAELLFTHGGTGSLITGLQAGCRIVAMPRDPARNEHYDHHQFEIVEAFARRGLIQMATTADELPAAVARARKMEVTRATTDYSELIGLLKRWYPAEKAAVTS